MQSGTRFFQPEDGQNVLVRYDDLLAKSIGLLVR